MPLQNVLPKNQNSTLNLRHSLFTTCASHCLGVGWLSDCELDISQEYSHHQAVRVSIVTPSYRSSVWLKFCISSVADQNAEVEHIVQDAGSDDGTLDWLSKDSRIRTFVEKDRGMYDAINRGFEKSSGDIL